MSKKFGARRKRAFLTYLSQTANQTLAAERACVSRSWVCLHRANDPAFDAACRAAIAEADAALSADGLEGEEGRSFDRLRTNGVETGLPAPHSPPLPSPPLRGHSIDPNGSTEPSSPLRPPAAGAAGRSLSLKGRGASRTPAGWDWHEGTALVVAGSNRRYAQVRRARAKQWTAATEKRFLSALSATCNVKAACAAVGLGQASAYNHRRRWPTFAAAWAKAEETAYLRLEAALIEAACNVGELPEFEPETPIEGMTVWWAMQLLHMHQHQVRGIGGRPGAPERRAATDEEVCKALTRGLRKFGVHLDKNGDPIKREKRERAE